jgi:hypothetical protein
VDSESGMTMDERIRKAKAEAWDEGFDAGERDVWLHWPADDSKGTIDCIPNPYKDHQKIIVEGEIEVCDTCINSLGYNIAWQQAHD